MPPGRFDPDAAMAMIEREKVTSFGGVPTIMWRIVESQLFDPPARARLIVASKCFPTGYLGYWVGRLAAKGLVAALTATSPPRRRISSPVSSSSSVGNGFQDRASRTRTAIGRR
jgi:acyl-CoA synthetase (AMP-forming)/AMP-acid ligase II